MPRPRTLWTASETKIEQQGNFQHARIGKRSQPPGGGNALARDSARASSSLSLKIRAKKNKIESATRSRNQLAAAGNEVFNANYGKLIMNEMNEINEMDGMNEMNDGWIMDGWMAMDG